MLIYAGIDEAGYGPMLGPLCVGCAVLVLEEHDPLQGAPDVWRLLKSKVCRASGHRRGQKLAVDDSKKLKTSATGRRHPLHRLERGVFGMYPSPDLPSSDTMFFRALGAVIPSRQWYCSETPLPLDHSFDELRILHASLARTLAANNARVDLLACEMMDAEEINRLSIAMGTKSAVNFLAAMRLVDRVWKHYPNQHPRVVIDRHGGRQFYRESLQASFPDVAMTVVAETSELSRYRMERGESSLTVTFCSEAESKHFPVALASMTAKLARDLMMTRLNRYFQSMRPEVKPTAGYVQDARRYLNDLRDVIRELRIPSDVLVRRV